MHDSPTSETEFIRFYREHWPRLEAAMALALPQGEDPADVAQEAFTRAYEHWEEVRVHPKPDGWLFLTGYRISSSLRRRAVTRAKAVGWARSTYQAEATGADLLEGLPARQRAALLLRHYYGLSTRETAEALGCREGTVKSLLARARQRLQIEIAIEGRES